MIIARRQSWIRYTTALLFALLLCVGNALAQSKLAANDIAQSKRPNVLFISVDDMRVELGCYGDTIALTPNIDALAARGLQFNRAYCQQAVCNPSRASVLTGMRPDSLGIWNLTTHFRERFPNVVTLPQHFKQQGYFTQNIGKIFHNWRQDKFQGDPLSWSVPAVMHYGTHGDDKAQVTGDLPPDQSHIPPADMREVPDNAYLDGRIAERAVAALGAVKQKEQPFFLAVGFWKPHSPFNAPKKYWDLYKREKISLAANPEPPTHVPPIALHDSREILRNFQQRAPNSAKARELRHGYYAAISYVDAQIGKVLNELDRLGLRESTIVVFWSDHGYHLGEHSLWAKTSNFELDTRVPLILATGNGKPLGTQTEALVELVDLYPTLVQLCDLPPVQHLEGTDLSPLLANPKQSLKEVAVSWHCRPAYPESGKLPEAMGWSIRTDRFRYTQWLHFTTNKLIAQELYDHQIDSQESNNVAGNEEHVEVVKELAHRLTTHRQRKVQLPNEP